MIPQSMITQWRNIAPWPQDAQVEQDLILSRALAELYREKDVMEQAAFRGGTAIHKAWLKAPARYSEDIDLVQVKAGPIGPLMDAVHRCLDSWLGKPQWKQGAGRVTFYYQFMTEIEPVQAKRLKVEINTREHFTALGIRKCPFKVDSRWWQGEAELATYAPEELLGTKLRALYQRKKGRDLFDLWYAAGKGGADHAGIVGCFQRCLANDGKKVSRAEFEKNMRAKLKDRDFLGDIEPLLAPEAAWDPKDAEKWLFKKIIPLLEGEPWKGPQAKGRLSAGKKEERLWAEN